MEDIKKLRFGLGFQVETDKGPVGLYSVNSDEDVSGTYVQSTDYNDLLRERNELAAQVERLRGAANKLSFGLVHDEPEWKHSEYTYKAFSELQDVIAETYTQSLEAVKREVRQKAFDDIAYAVRYEFEGPFSSDSFDSFIESIE